MNTENGKISDRHRLSLNLFSKINWERPDKYVPGSNVSVYYAWKYIKINK